MLELDVGRLSKAELQEAVSCHCAQFGTVKRVAIRAATWDPDYGVAAVEMESALEAENLLGRFGDAKYGNNIVIIRLAPCTKPIPVSLRRDAATAVAQRGDCYLTQSPVASALARAANDPANARV